MSRGLTRKLSSSIKSESNRSIFVANAQRPSRETLMFVSLPDTRNPSRARRATRRSLNRYTSIASKSGSRVMNTIPASVTAHKNDHTCSSASSDCPPATATRISLRSLGAPPDDDRDKRCCGPSGIPAARRHWHMSLGRIRLRWERLAKYLESRPPVLTRNRSKPPSRDQVGLRRGRVRRSIEEGALHPL